MAIAGRLGRSGTRTQSAGVRGEIDFTPCGRPYQAADGQPDFAPVSAAPALWLAMYSVATRQRSA